MLQLHADLIAEAQKAHGTGPWVFLYRLVADSNVSATPTFQLTPNPAPIAFGADTYSPYPLTHTQVAVDDQGTLPQVDLILSNVTGELSRYCEVGRGFMGSSVTITYTHADHAAAGRYVEQGTFEVSGLTMTRDSVVLRLVVPGLTLLRAPQDVYVRDRCRWGYGSPECGVVLDSPMTAVFPTCPKTLDACRDRGNHEVTLGRARLHPRRYGGFPTLPRNVR